MYDVMKYTCGELYKFIRNLRKINTSKCVILTVNIILFPERTQKQIENKI